MKNDSDYQPAVTVRSPDGKTTELSTKDLRNAAIDAKKNAEKEASKSDRESEDTDRYPKFQFPD